jgi:cell division protein FtsL
MKKIMNSLRRVKLVVRKSRPVTKVVALCAVVLSTVTLLTLQSAILDSRKHTAEMMEQANKLEQQNQLLEQRIDGLDTEAGIREIAQQELGLADPNTVILVPEQ